MGAYEEYEKRFLDDGEKQKEAVNLSTKAQIDQLAENRKLVEAEKQNAFRGAYVDYAKNINPYGVQSELAYGSGLGGAGKGETAQANYYNTYQSRLGEINTNATGQLRDIANQETNVRLAGEQAKLSIDSAINQQLAAEKLNDARIAEGYAREDKANAYNQLLTAITSAGYNPTDEELIAAGMTRAMADKYRSAYQSQLAASYASSPKSYDPSTALSKLKDFAENGDFEGALAYLAQEEGKGLSLDMGYALAESAFGSDVWQKQLDDLELQGITSIYGGLEKDYPGITNYIIANSKPAGRTKNGYPMFQKANGSFYYIVKDGSKYARYTTGENGIESFSE